MKLSLFHLDRLPDVVRDELTQLVARINTVWSTDHDPQTGAHRFGTTQSTVGTAGSASAPPANPVRWAQVTYIDADGATQTGVVPIYDPS